jgi:hypothetical protein
MEVAADMDPRPVQVTIQVLKWCLGNAACLWHDPAQPMESNN